MRFVDSHVHLCEYQETFEILSTARSTETLLLSSGIDRRSSLRTLEIARAAPGLVKAFVGVHPSEAQLETDLEWFEAALGEAAGAGELGLDPKYSEVVTHSPQMAVLIRQLEVVEKAGKPVQLHTRGAERECLELLRSYRLRAVLLHWFQGESNLGKAEERGYFVSFGPALLQSRRLQRMASSLEPSQVLAESDGPVSFAALGGVGGPSLIPTVAFKLAWLWNLTFSEAEKRLLSNTLGYLGESESGKT
jgi:TatD DNase family protein